MFIIKYAHNNMCLYVKIRFKKCVFHNCMYLTYIIKRSFLFQIKTISLFNEDAPSRFFGFIPKFTWL